MHAVTVGGSLFRARYASALPKRVSVAREKAAAPWRRAPRPAPERVEQVAAGTEHSVYRPGGGRKRALAITLAIHAVLLTAALSARTGFDRAKPQPALHTFDVTSPPPPPPAPLEQVPQAGAAPSSPIVAPPPKVIVPQPGPAMQTVAEAPAQPAPASMMVSGAPAPATVAVALPAPAASPAPAAPITPPDFNAAQLNNPGPAYPFLARKAREAGVVMLRVLVTDGGRAGDVKLHGSSGSPRLDQAALATVKRWKFVPAKQAGKPVQAWVLVPITFKLG